ncbi:DUF1778 domain-containing protein [Bifidobacterium saguinibicoloris]|uniref:type II toxin-antitoxin system TacA family antitoxin n=1 Tax=Bifidobacterium saguinibicoloris TaxID=2834433 RepID=UPI001C58B1E1|nr:DUF1778 domain-containing protein [Bifidobacterium saguinibicoloris]MBW3080020.1 DUF1778 domain-containing protein [Bifidobacterium saguinibicoloris]
MATITQKSSRLDIRLTEEQRALIERAAALTGSTITQWTARHLIEAARRDIDEETTLRLDDASFDAFLAALEAPVPDAAKELMARDPQWA